MSEEARVFEDNNETKKHIKIEPGTTICWHCGKTVKLEQAWHSTSIVAKYFCNKCNVELSHY